MDTKVPLKDFNHACARGPESHSPHPLPARPESPKCSHLGLTSHNTSVMKNMHAQKWSQTVDN